MTTKDRFIPTLDGWRAIAIGLVLTAHGADSIFDSLSVLVGHGIDRFRPSLHAKELIGGLGVHLFFSLSGYLITTRLLIEEAFYGGICLKQFYLRRIFRIQPAALFYLSIAGIMGLLGLLAVTPAGWVSAALMIANLVPGGTWPTGHFWSLAVEEHFYIFWPVIFILTKNRRFQLGMGIIILLLVWRAFVIKTGFTREWRFAGRSDIEAIWLISGCLAAQAHRGRPALISRLTDPNAWVLSVISLAVLSGMATGWKASESALMLAAVLMPLVFVSTATAPHSLITRALETPWVTWVGRVSFSLYLWQQLFMAWPEAASAAMGRAQTFPVNLGLSIICAAASYRWVELPMLKVGKRLYGKSASSQER